MTVKRTTMVEAVLALFAAILCWACVSWSLRPGLFLLLDEISTKGAVMILSYRQILNILPIQFYADRPLGWAFIKLMDDRFGFDYQKEIACLLVFHFANCGLGLWLFRKLGASVPLGLAGIALFGSLWTTSQTAPYLGECFDAICLFFLLGSIVAMLSDRWMVSAVLFFLALRSKEFAIFTPFLLTLLLALRLPRLNLIRGLAKRLWLHYAILIAIGIRYATLYRVYRADAAPDSPYRMDFHVSTVVESLAYYTRLIFGEEDSRWHIPPWVLAGLFAATFVWSVIKKRSGIAFGIATYFSTALPVLLMPYTRAEYWVYGPQLFLILAFTLLVQDAIQQIWTQQFPRWVAAVCVALVCMGWCVTFRRSSYFHDRVHWNIEVRGISARTAHDVNAELPRLAAGTHIYVDHKPDTVPWLFFPGPCTYLRLRDRQPEITCVLDNARAVYDSDHGPKFLVDYHDDGSIAIR